jgi:hypothetical protein
MPSIGSYSAAGSGIYGGILIDLDSFPGDITF